MSLSPPSIVRKRRRSRAMAAVAVTCALVAGMAGLDVTSAGATSRTPVSGAPSGLTDSRLNPPPPTAPSGYAALVPQVPPAPQALVNGRLRPLSLKELANLTGTGRPVGSFDCEVTFDDDDAIEWLVNDAVDTFVTSPWWNQYCADNWVRVFPSHIDHFHLIYTDPNVTVCLNSDNDYDTPVGAMSRGAQDCEPIDAITEPRDFANSMLPTDVLNIERLHGGDYDVMPFTLQRIKAVTVPIRLCFQVETEGPWVAGLPPGPDDHPGQYCWPSLGVGTWDLSQYVKNAIRVTVKVASSNSPNFGIDNIRLDW